MKIKNWILVFFILVLVFGIGIFIWNRGQQRDTNPLNNKKIAEQTLVNFFDSLASKDYKNAVKIFYPLDPSGKYEWELVTQYRDSTKQNPSKAEDLAYYCEAVGTCLKVEILNNKEEKGDNFIFEVQFKEKDGSILLYGPFGGLTAEQSPPETKFRYEVKRIDGVYKVITPPLYRP